MKKLIVFIIGFIIFTCIMSGCSKPSDIPTGQDCCFVCPDNYKFT